jgi:hypothetical protein
MRGGSANGSDPADSLVASLTADIKKLGLVASSTSTHPIKEKTVFLQYIRLQHYFIRSCDTSGIVEKPERLRAVNIGLAAAKAQSLAATKVEPEYALPTASASGDLVAALGRMNLAAQGIDPLESSSPVSKTGGVPQYLTDFLSCSRSTHPSLTSEPTLYHPRLIRLPQLLILAFVTHGKIYALDSSGRNILWSSILGLR